MAACYIFIRAPYSADPKIHSRSVFYEIVNDRRTRCLWLCVCLFMKACTFELPGPPLKKMTLPTIMPCKTSYKRRSSVWFHHVHYSDRLITDLYTTYTYMDAQCIHEMKCTRLYSAVRNLWWSKAINCRPSDSHLLYRAECTTPCGQKKKRRDMDTNLL